MIEDMGLLNKDTSQSCIFDFPDRPVRPVPPIDPNNPPAPPQDYPYEPILDWPASPPINPVPGVDPIPGSNPHPHPPPHDSPLWTDSLTNILRSSLRGTTPPNPINLRISYLGSMNVPGDSCFLYHGDFTVGPGGSSEQDCLSQLDDYVVDHPEFTGTKSCLGLSILTKTYLDYRLFYMFWHGFITPNVNVFLPCNILYDLSFHPLPNTESIPVGNWSDGLKPQMDDGESVLARWHQLSNPSEGFSWRIL